MRSFLVVFIFTLNLSAKNTASLQIKNKISKVDESIFSEKSEVREDLSNLENENNKYLTFVRVKKKIETRINEIEDALLKSDELLLKKRRKLTNDILVLNLLDHKEASIEEKIVRNKLERKLEASLKELKKSNSSKKELLDEIDEFKTRLSTISQITNDLLVDVQIIERKTLERKSRINSLYEKKNILEEELINTQANEIFKKTISHEKINESEGFQFLFPLKKYERVKKKSPGVEFITNLSQKVYAIDSGTVAYNDVLANFGKIIILKHKDNLRSVYLGDFQSNITKGDSITKGESLGHILEGENQKIYFELRSEEKPLELEKYYSMKEFQKRQL